MQYNTTKEYVHPTGVYGKDRHQISTLIKLTGDFVFQIRQNKSICFPCRRHCGSTNVFYGSAFEEFSGATAICAKVDSTLERRIQPGTFKIHLFIKSEFVAALTRRAGSRVGEDENGYST